MYWNGDEKFMALEKKGKFMDETGLHCLSCTKQSKVVTTVLHRMKRHNA